MKKILALAIVALVVPSVALAAKPPSPPGQSNSNSHSKAAPKVVYVLKGVITSFNSPAPPFTVPGTGAGTSNPTAVTYSCPSGTSWVTITVRRVNHWLRKFEQLPGQPTQPSHPPLSLQLTVCLNAKTKVIVKGSGRVDLANLTNVSLGTNGNHGVVKVRYAKKFDPTNPTSLEDFLMNGPAKQVIVKKALPTS